MLDAWLRETTGWRRTTSFEGMAAGLIEPDPLKLAIRVYPQPHGGGDRRGRETHTLVPPARNVCFRYGTRIDTTQSLADVPIVLGIFEMVTASKKAYFDADDLRGDELSTLEQYAATHRAQTDGRR